MTARLAEPTLRLTALAGWVTSHRHGTWDIRAETDLFGERADLVFTEHAASWTLHWATLSHADDLVQGTAACGLHLDRDLEWWRASRHALDHAARRGDVWKHCGACLYWAGGLP